MKITTESLKQLILESLEDLIQQGDLRYDQSALGLGDETQASPCSEEVYTLVKNLEKFLAYRRQKGDDDPELLRALEHVVGKIMQHI